MDYYSSEINRLIEELSTLPGIGAKSAQRRDEKGEGSVKRNVLGL